MDKREKIIEAARARFREYGIRKTTMQEIAEDAGVAVGTLYRYFKDKDDLILAGTEDFVSRHRKQVETLLKRICSAEEKIRRYLVGRFQVSEEIRKSSRHAAELTRAVLRLKPDRLLDEAEIMCSAMAQMLQQGNDSGEWQIKDPPRDARALLISVAIFFPNALSEPSIEPKEEDLIFLLEWFFEQWERKRE